MVGVGYVGLACKNAGGYPARAIMQAQVEANVGDIGHDHFHAYYAKRHLNFVQSNCFVHCI